MTDTDMKWIRDQYDMHVAAGVQCGKFEEFFTQKAKAIQDGITEWEQKKWKAMEAFKAYTRIVKAAVPHDVASAMTPSSTANVWGTIVHQTKAGIMSDFGITHDEWDEFFEGYNFFE